MSERKSDIKITSDELSDLVKKVDELSRIFTKYLRERPEVKNVKQEGIPELFFNLGMPDHLLIKGIIEVIEIQKILRGIIEGAANDTQQDLPTLVDILVQKSDKSYIPGYQTLGSAEGTVIQPVYDREPDFSKLSEKK